MSKTFLCAWDQWGRSYSCFFQHSSLSISGEISSAIAKYLGSSTFNTSIMKSESRKGKMQSLSMSFAVRLDFNNFYRYYWPCWRLSTHVHIVNLAGMCTQTSICSDATKTPKSGAKKMQPCCSEGSWPRARSLQTASYLPYHAIQAFCMEWSTLWL